VISILEDPIEYIVTSPLEKRKCCSMWRGERKRLIQSRRHHHEGRLKREFFGGVGLGLEGKVGKEKRFL